MRALYSSGRRGGSSQVYPCLTADPIDLSMGGPTRAFAWGFFCRGLAPTALRAYPWALSWLDFAGSRRIAAESLCDSATALRRPIRRFAPGMIQARALSWLDLSSATSAGCQPARCAKSQVTRRPGDVSEECAGEIPVSGGTGGMASAAPWLTSSSPRPAQRSTPYAHTCRVRPWSPSAPARSTLLCAWRVRRRRC